MNEENIKKLLVSMKFNIKDNDYIKYYSDVDCSIKIDFKNKHILYPCEKGFVVNDNTTTNFDKPENFVVLECINRLFEKGYRPEHIELEKRWNLGHDSKGGKADICIYNKDKNSMLCIIECKTFGSEYTKELNNTLIDGGQLFSYWQQERSTKWLVIYSSKLENNEIVYKTESINCSDDANILELSRKDQSIEVYKNASTVGQLYAVWKETYDRSLYGDILFSVDTQAYNIGIKPLQKKDLINFEENNKIVNRFEEILRHNNVSDKENAFNKLIALFICKLVDEINKRDDDIVDFQYKNGTDTYESLQDRLQKLHKQGMDEFMKEKIFYVSDDYAENLIKSYTGQNRERMIEELKNTLRILKFYTNNDFAFKDVHNEELFYQNGKVVVEMVELFQKYKIISSNNLQLLGDLFEQLLNKGFKQNEGQFFTPVPITRFIWNSIPIESIMVNDTNVKYPKIIDYACGSGHFLTEGYERINKFIKKNNQEFNQGWEEHKIFGIEKDYRLARVSKISLFMHGAGNGKIIYGDGLENYNDKEIIQNSFDILVANPPYAVSGFKPHLKIKDNKFDTLSYISNDGSEIETLFVERINQLLKPNGIAAVILPNGILNKESNSFISAREFLLKNFNIKAIVLMGGKTFGATGQNTAIMFLKKFDEPPKRVDMVMDSVDAIFSEEKGFVNFEDDEILINYLTKIEVSKEDYFSYTNRAKSYKEWNENKYFNKYVDMFERSSIYQNKIKQSSFTKLEDFNKEIELSVMFYNFVDKIEKEKLLYFGLVYKQKTLIVVAPDDNKKQEQFLGYKWSNRKGQEGIQIISDGGLLYSDDDSTKISDLIRAIYDDETISEEKLSEYYYYLDTKDMLDFKNVNFSNVIKTNKVRTHKAKSGYYEILLSDKKFSLKIGSRVLADEIMDEGKYPVYSANVFEPFGYKDETNISDTSKDSIIWGIDGDWMVNVISKNNPFYATDHCGVLQVNDDSINPYYLSYALNKEGKIERFSRVNRPSIERIRQLKLFLPSINVQNKLVDKIKKFDDKIVDKLNDIAKIKEESKKIFEKYFGNLQTNDKKWKFEKLNKICDVKDGTHDSPKYVLKSDYPLLTSKNFTKGFIDFSNVNYISKEDFDKINQRSKVDVGDIIMPMIGTIGNPVIVNTEKPFAIKNVALIKFGNSEYSQEFIQGVLNSSYFENYVNEKNKGGNRKFLTLDDIRNINIPIVSHDLDLKYKNDIMNINIKVDKIQKEIEKIEEEKAKAIMDILD